MRLARKMISTSRRLPAFDLTKVYRPGRAERGDSRKQVGILAKYAGAHACAVRIVTMEHNDNQKSNDAACDVVMDHLVRKHVEYAADKKTCRKAGGA